MVMLLYKKQFADDVQAGIKTTTIRAPRQRPFKVGDILTHYQGSRFSKHKKFLMTGRVIKTAWIIVSDNPPKVYLFSKRYDESTGRGVHTYGGYWLRRFAQRDGFDSVEDFMRFFKDSLGVKLEWIKWKTITPKRRCRETKDLFGGK